MNIGTVSNSTDVHRKPEQLGSNYVCASAAIFALFAQSIANYPALGQVYNHFSQTAHGCGVLGIQSWLLGTSSSVGGAGITILMQLPDCNPPSNISGHLYGISSYKYLSFFKFSINISLIIQHKDWY